MAPPYGYITSYSPRLRQYGNALLVPIIPQTQTAPAPRTTKRGTVAVNYAENEFDDDDFDDSDAPRRPTGLRSLRREELNPDRNPAGEKLGTEIFAPVNVQPILRHWMGKKPFKPGRAKQIRSQAQLPLTLVPIRIDLEVPAHQPGEPFPLPRNYLELGINPVLPAYRKPEPAPPYRVKDAFLWNLHEALATPEEFATIFVRDLDLPNPQATVMTVTNQIRQQLEEYAGVALHPLFLGAQGNVLTNNGTRVTSRDASATPATPMATNAATPSSLPDGMSAKGTVQVTAEPFPPNDSELNTDDAYRCIVNLNINLQNRLYTDKFEWSLLYTHGLAEEFSKITCADIGLGSEWVNSIAHGIYEAVLKLKKETCESGGLISGMGGYGNEIDNQAIEGHEAGWRYDPEGLGDEWEPKIEALSKEEIEKREGDRERQIRRLRRETARFSSTTGMAPDLTRQSSSGYFDVPDSDTPMGRGERNKKKRRFRSLSPGGRSGTPGARATPDTGAGAGYGGGGGTLNEWERQTWRCANCSVWGTAVWAVRDGPAGPRECGDRRSATIVGFYTNGINRYRHGQGAFTAWTFPLDVDLPRRE